MKRIVGFLNKNESSQGLLDHALSESGAEIFGSGLHGGGGQVVLMRGARGLRCLSCYVLRLDVLIIALVSLVSLKVD